MLGETIIAEGIQKRIDFINRQAPRNFDEKADILTLSLSVRQFLVVEKDFHLKERRGYGTTEITEFDFGEWHIKPKYNERMNIYELNITHKTYIEDLDAQLDYLEERYGERP